jgi:isopenicillin-N epimerase
MRSPSLTRRDFARLFAAGGSAALLAHPAVRELAAAAPRRPVRAGGAVDWEAVRDRFLLPRELSVLNAANLCPSPTAVLQSLHDDTERLDREPVPTFRTEMHGVKERARELLATHLRVSPEEILITRNTSEANNWVSAGLDLEPGDEVVILDDNHPSNNLAWKARARRFGYAVKEVAQVNPHPGADWYVEAFRGALTSRTRVLAFTHLTNTSGDLLPAAELCRMAREHGVLTLMDGAQTFGLLDVDLSAIQPDFYTGSAHKWPCGPMETGVLFVSRRVQDRLWPSLYSAYTGATPLARTHEGMGQRDEPAIRAFGREIEFLDSIGQDAIEARSRGLANELMEGLGKLGGVRFWTSPEPERRAAVVSFDPAGLDPGRTVAALEADGIVASPSPGAGRPGIRLSPHFYNSSDDVGRAVDAIRRYMRSGL